MLVGMNAPLPGLAAVLPPHRGKTAPQESFPVALRWLAGGHRAAILRFYGYVRAADDWADLPDPGLSVADRLAGLHRLATAAERDLAAIPAALAAFKALLPAFEADARGDLPTDLATALATCRASSVPVGRFLLDLHGESPLTYPAADALCLSLQLLNHLDDSPADRARWGRAYLPTAALPAIHTVLPRLLAEAAPLPQLLRAPGLRRQAAATVMAAQRQAAALADGRPFGLRDRLACARAALVPARPPRPRLSGSFRLALPLLPADARAAIAGVYAHARAWDALADEAGDLTALHAWHDRLTGLAEGRFPADLPPDFLALLTRYRLPLPPFLALLDGLISDLTAPPQAPDRAALLLYCDRVAGAVGTLILAALGIEDDALARSAGRALQLTNILRDLDADAATGRVYLTRADLPALVPEVEALYADCTARLAARRFRGRWGVAVMIGLYRRLFRRLQAQAFAPGGRLTGVDRLAVLLRGGRG